MRAVTLHERTDPKVSTVAASVRVVGDWPQLAPRPGEARVRTLASALNRMDIWTGMGIPGVDITYPHVGGCDACGVVEEVGDGVDESWVGKRVIVNAATRIPPRVHPGDPTGATLAPDYELLGEHHPGFHKAEFCAPAANLAPVADDADPVEAAAYGLCALTAYSMMCTKGGLRPGQGVLITGIGGGVATAALAIAKWLACPVVVTSRHGWKLERARELGADHAILDEGQDWSKEVRAWTNKRGVDMAIDSVGKPTHLNCIKSLARGGAFVTPGNTGGPRVETDQARLFWNQLRLLGSTMGSNDEFREVVSLFNAGLVSPVVDAVIPASDARSAWERLEAGEQFGKIVLDWQA